jgi:hypothetical protein
MNIDFKNCTEEELWKYVAVHLKKHNIDTILVGGAVVSIYSEGAYESGDLDFVLTDMFTCHNGRNRIFQERRETLRTS